VLFACLVVERCVHQRSGALANGFTQGMTAILEACPQEGKVFKQLLRKHPALIVNPDSKETFFDDRQMKILTQGADNTRDEEGDGGVEGTPRRTICN